MKTTYDIVHKLFSAYFHIDRNQDLREKRKVVLMI